MYKRIKVLKTYSAKIRMQLNPELDRRGPCSKRRNLTNARTVRNPSDNLSCSPSTCNALSIEFAKERSIPLASQRAGSGRGTLEEVGLASPSERSAALLVRGGIGRSEELASILSDNVLDIVEDIAFENAAGPSVTTLEKMTLDIEPDVVDGMEEGLATEGGAATSSLGDVVVLHGDGVAGTDHLKDPVVVAIAARGVVGGAVDEVAGKSNAGAGSEAKDIMLATRASSLTDC